MTKLEFKTVKVDDSVGHVLLHDITEIVPGKIKGAAFKKGHIIEKSDVSKLKDLGKENIYIFEIPENFYHEDEAAEKFRSFAGKNISTQGPSEGKIVYEASISGFLHVDKQAVDSINQIGQIALTTVHSNISVKKGDKIAGARIIPLAIEKSKVERSLSYVNGSVFELKPFVNKNIGLIVTGGEVASGRIEDGFRPVIEKKIKQYHSEIKYYAQPGDELENLKDSINTALDKACDFIIMTGGMSVDPDDNTKTAIAEYGFDVVNYGVPVLPGNMFMAAYLKDIPVFGIPACALFFDITVLDLFFPYAFSNTKIEKEDMLRRGYGGYCRHCKVCTFPNCAFGRC